MSDSTNIPAAPAPVSTTEVTPATVSAAQTDPQVVTTADVPLGGSASHLAAPSSPEVASVLYKGQRVLRTAFQWLVGSIAPVIAILGYAHDVWPVSWLAGALVVAGGIQVFITRVMANTAVNTWLSTHTFLGSIPKSVAADPAVSSTTA